MTRRATIALLALFATTTLISACGSDEDNGSSTSTAAAAESESEASYEIVSDAEVASGFSNLIATMTSLATDPSTVDDAALDEVEGIWFGFEGTVKQNDPDSYLTCEEALDSFVTGSETKDAAAMTTATAKLSTAAAAYLAAHPG